jgi:hypothetical protein
VFGQGLGLTLTWKANGEGPSCVHLPFTPPAFCPLQVDHGYRKLLSALGKTPSTSSGEGM